MAEAWDKSREKAKELRIENWGSLDEVIIMAEPIRQASSRHTAMNYLREISEHSPFISRSGLTARLSRRSLGKIVSHAAVINSITPEAHYLAAANIDKIFSNAIEPWEFELNPNKENAGLKARRYLYAPMQYDGEIFIVKFTVKEFENIDLENKIYAIEAVFVDLSI